MSQENVEIVRRYFEGQAAHEPSEWVAEFWESNGDYYPPPKLPEARSCHGSEEIVRFSTEFRSAWKGLRYEVKDARAIGDDRVFVHRRVSAKGRTSGVPLEGDVYHCCWLRHGRFIRVEDHLTAKGALHALGLSGETLEAAGLSEQAMSQENVEIVREHIEAFRQGDAPGALSHLDPHVVWDPSRARGIVVPVAYGHEEVSQTIRHYIGAFEDYDFVAQRLTDLGSGAVLALLTEEGRGKSSGAPVRQSSAALYTVIDGKIARITFFPSEAEALEAAGVRE